VKSVLSTTLVKSLIGLNLVSLISCISDCNSQSFYNVPEFLVTFFGKLKVSVTTGDNANQHVPFIRHL